jgi:hypothetical protein
LKGQDLELHRSLISLDDSLEPGQGLRLFSSFRG